MSRPSLIVLLAIITSALNAEEPSTRLFRTECSACHGLDGLSKGPSGTRLPGRILADGTWLSKQEDSSLLKSIQNGKGAMPSYQGRLKPEELNGLVRYIRSLVKPKKKPGRR